MKTITSILALGILASCCLVAQNLHVRFQDQFSAFRDCRALSNGIMLAAGERGRMIRSTDYGEHWRTVEIPTFAHFTRMDFADDKRGVIADDSGRVWLTADAGASWQSIFTADQPLTSIARMNGQTFMAVGRNGSVWRGDAAANQWKKLAVGLDSVELADVACSGVSGIIVGKWGAAAITTDGGESWVRYALPNVQSYDKCGFITPQLALITGRDTTTGASRFYRYHVAAGRWDTINPQHFRRVLDFAVVADTTIFSVGQQGLLMLSRDSATTWNIADTLTVDFTPNGYRITDGVHCISINHDGSGLAAGGYVAGTLATTADYGKTWTIRSESPGDLEYYNPYHGFAHGDDSVIIVGGFRKRMYRTTDGGATWRRPYPASSFKLSSFYRVHFVNKTRGYAVGSAEEGPWCFATTSDGGATWSNIQQIGEYLTFGDPQHGYMTRLRASPKSFEPIFFTSKDSGATWSNKYFKDVGLTDTAGLRWIGVPHFGSPGKGATILSRANIATFFHTEDFGDTWNKGTVFDSASGIEHIHWKSENTVFAFGRWGDLQRSDDGGKQWRVLNSGLTSLSCIAFLNDSVGIVAGFDGTVSISANGGERWNKVSAPTKFTSFEVNNNFGGDNYNGICRVNDTTAYLLGTSRILRVVISAGKPTSVEETPVGAIHELPLHISPNPAAEYFTVSCPDGAAVTVRDVFGRSVYAGEGGAVSTSGWAAGVYFVEAAAGASRSVGMVAVGR